MAAALLGMSADVLADELAPATIAPDRIDAPKAANGLSTDPFAALVGRRAKRQDTQRAGAKIERYVLATDDRSFLFQDRSDIARIQFLCSEEDIRFECIVDRDGDAGEIYEVIPNRGPRGDVIYKNREGETLLRIASYGGATVFWPGDYAGSAASKSFGDKHSLELTPASREVALARAQSATAILSAVTGAPIQFEVGGSSSAIADPSLLADAIVMAGKALHGVAGDPTGARIVGSRISRVRFAVADAPAANLDGRVLLISLTPDRGLSGRPSSAAIRGYLEANL